MKYEEALRRITKEAKSYIEQFDKPLRPKLIRLYVQHDLRVIGVRLNDALEELHDRGVLRVFRLPVTGHRAILTDDLVEIAEASGPMGLMNYLAKFENGDFDYKPGEE